MDATALPTPNLSLSHRDLFLTGAIVPSIHRWLNEILIFNELEYFPIIRGECNESRKICRLYWLTSGRVRYTISLLTINRKMIRTKHPLRIPYSMEHQNNALLSQW
jgi:hypothetical protein